MQISFFVGKESAEALWINSLKLEIGGIIIDIPLDPGFIHEAVIRGQKNLSEQFTLFSAPQMFEESTIQVKRRTVPTYTR